MKIYEADRFRSLGALSLLAIAFLFLVNSFLYYLIKEDQDAFNYLLFCFLCLFYATIVVSELLSIKKTITAIFTGMNVLLVFIIIIYWETMPIRIIWVYLLVYFYYMNWRIEKIGWYVFGIIIFLVLTPYISNSLRFLFKLAAPNPLKIEYQIIGIVLDILVFVTVSLSLIQFNSIKNRKKIFDWNFYSEWSIIDTKNQNNSSLKSTLNAELDFKIVLLYKKIDKHILYKKPYINPKYSIENLSQDLDLDVIYIIKALQNSEEKELDFKLVLNYYRIQDIKNQLKQNMNLAKTIDVVYKSVGFQKKVVFANAFKSVEKISYLEYIKTLKEDGTHF